MSHVDVLVTAVDQGDDQGPKHSATPEQIVLDQTQPAEVDLGQLARRDVGDTHRRGLLAEAAALDREAVQRAVGDVDPAALEQLVDLGQLERVPVLNLTAEPLPDLIPLRLELALRLARTDLGRPGTQPGLDAGGQGLVGLLLAWLPAELPGNLQVSPDRRPRPARRPRDRPLSLPAVRSP
jgi:hypothetical protein